MARTVAVVAVVALVAAAATTNSAVAQDPAPADKPTASEDINKNCVCPPQDLKSRARSKHVFVGKAVERNDNPKFDGERMESKAEYRFEVDEWFKGELPDPVLVRTFKASCSTAFEIGKTYVVFGNQNEHEQLTASYCNGNRIATPANVAELRSIIGDSAAAKKGNGKSAADKKSGKNGKNGKATAAAGDAASTSKTEDEGQSMLTLLALAGAAVVLILLIVTLLRRKKS